MTRVESGFGGLCQGCLHARVIVSDRGSRFLLCGRAKDEPRLTKYPPQPVISCFAWEEYPRDAPAAGEEEDSGGVP